MGRRGREPVDEHEEKGDSEERGGRWKKWNAQRFNSNMGVLSGTKLGPKLLPGKMGPCMCFEKRFTTMIGIGCSCEANVGLRENK